MKNGSVDHWMVYAHSNVTSAAKPTASPARGVSTPRAAIIAASDFPVSPMALTGAAEGEIYEIRTVAGLVPPSSGEDIDRSVGAALEFAVKVYGVDHIIVLAHPGCGLIRCLIDEESPGAHAVLQGQFLPAWTSIAAPALTRVLQGTMPEDERARICCQEIVRISFENLMTYQWVLDSVFNGRLALHGWYVDTHRGVFSRFDPDTDGFVTP